MPSIETDELNQNAVLWTPATVNRYGEKRVSAPVELLEADMNGVRWITKRRIALDSQGNKIALDASVIAAREVVVNSLMWLGTLEEMAADGFGTGTGTSDGPTSELYEVVTSSITPDIKNRYTRWELGLVRYKDRLPRVA